jgi:hypothetical protein
MQMCLIVKQQQRRRSMFKPLAYAVSVRYALNSGGTAGTGGLTLVDAELLRNWLSLVWLEQAFGSKYWRY